MNSIARVLIVAGSDSGGGAGIQADLKTVTALGGYAATAITALTAQNTREVREVLPVPPSFVRAQLEAVLDDIGADALKTGMLHDRQVIEVVAGVVESRTRGLPLVVDPVMVAESGGRLLLDTAVGALQERLLPLATLITPNLPEAEVLLGRPIANPEAVRRAAEELHRRFGAAVLVKGGHLPGPRLTDVLYDHDGEHLFEDDRIVTRSTHGTGCTLASAVATGLAHGLGTAAAVAEARRYLRQAILTAVPLGGGHGPVNHGHPCRRPG